ncbi:MAG: hypothetical protein AAB339_12015 [Elusimicrobiota bacterium]
MRSSALSAASLSLFAGCLFQARWACAGEHEALRARAELLLPAAGLEARVAPPPSVEDIQPPAVQGLPLDPHSIYAALYASGMPPRLADIAGDWRGEALVFARQAPLPRIPALEQILAAVSLKIWEGKSFDGQGGANRFLHGRLRLFRFSASIQASRTGSGDALALDYSSNGYPLSAIRDEVRLLPDGRLLGRAYLHAPEGRDHFLFFFLLEKEETR